MRCLHEVQEGRWGGLVRMGEKTSELKSVDKRIGLGIVMEDHERGVSRRVRPGDHSGQFLQLLPGVQIRIAVPPLRVEPRLRVPPHEAEVRPTVPGNGLEGHVPSDAGEVDVDEVEPLLLQEAMRGRGVPGIVADIKKEREGTKRLRELGQVCPSFR